MSVIHVFKREGKEWVTHTTRGETKARILGVDQAHTFRSLGLHPNGGLCIAVNGQGLIDEVTLHTGDPVYEFYVPTNHSLSMVLDTV